MAPVLDPPVYGKTVEVLDGVTRVTAENPSIMTGPGTNTYLVGHADLVAIDPGPDDEQHARFVAEAAGGRLRAIVVTHTHPDHSPCATELARLTGARLIGHGPRDGYEPDETVADGDVIAHGDIPLLALYTPGHASNHLAYLSTTDDEVVLFSGDHVMSGSTVVIAPPDGDMAAYLASLKRVLELQPPATVIAPGHGSMLKDPSRVIEDYIAHRMDREQSVLASLDARGQAHIEEIVADVYVDVPEVLHPVARFSVWAHLRKLRDEGRADSTDPDVVTGQWSVVDQ